MILLTGATGYIGSHVWIELLKSAKPVIGLDNLSNSNIECLEAISKITGIKPTFIQGDIRDMGVLDEVFSKYSITEVIHLAALKDVQESIYRKAEYFDVNVYGFEQLIKAMRKNGCHKIIFSSSAAVYGQEVTSPIIESANLSPSSYYGETKLLGEQMLESEFSESLPINSISLRYFNVAGKHSSGLLDGYGSKRSTSLFSEIERVIKGESERLSIFGDDWGTIDGTCIRDYLHVSDLAKGHIDALNHLNHGCLRLNLGLGIGQSVNNVILSYEQVIGRSIPCNVAPRREGDVGESYANTFLAVKFLDWNPVKTLFDMCEDSYKSCVKSLR